MNKEKLQILLDYFDVENEEVEENADIMWREANEDEGDYHE